MHQFLDDASNSLSISHWLVQIEWCIGDEYAQVEQSAKNPKKYSTKGLRSVYATITQTIDGILTAYKNEKEIVRFEAVDSSYWEITSENGTFLSEMEKNYGLYTTRVT